VVVVVLLYVGGVRGGAAAGTVDAVAVVVCSRRPVVARVRANAARSCGRRRPRRFAGSRDEKSVARPFAVDDFRDVPFVRVHRRGFFQLLGRPERGQRDGVEDHRKISSSTAASPAAHHADTQAVAAHARPRFDARGRQAATAAVASDAAARRQVRDQEATGETVE